MHSYLEEGEEPVQACTCWATAKVLATAIQQRKDEADAEVVLYDTILCNIWLKLKLMACIKLPKY